MKRAAWISSVVLLFCAVNVLGQTHQRAGLQKQFLYRVHAVRVEMLMNPTEQEDAVAEEHFTYLKDLTAKGVVILAGRTLNADESSFGIVIFHAESEEAARRIMEGDPGVRKGIFRADLFPFRVALVESTKGR
jgi:uncharacterized protein